MRDETLCYLSAVALRDRLRKQEVTPVELTEIFIDRIEAINPTINAYCTTAFDAARKMAKEAMARDQSPKSGYPLNGIPLSIKDLICTEGILTTFGSKLYSDHIPGEDAEVVRRLKQAGCVILGKTNTPDFGYAGAKTDNMVFGLTRNPWDLTKTTGGSSGGAAAAVAAGLSPLALGSDGGGSIRHPSSFCGVFGLKPQRGRVPTDQKSPFKHIHGYNNTTFGPIARFVEDAALMLDVIKGHSALDPCSLPNQHDSYLKAIDARPDRLKVALSMTLGYAKHLDPEVERAVRHAAGKLGEIGWEVEEPQLKIRNPDSAMSIYYCSLFAAKLAGLYKKHPEAFDPQFGRLIEAGMRTSAVDLLNTEVKFHKFFLEIAKLHQIYDILLTPTVALPAFNASEMFPTQINGKNVSPTGWMPFTFPFNLTGHPAASVPVGFTSGGLPIGMQVVGRLYDEARVLQVAKALQDILPWQAKLPRIH